MVPCSIKRRPPTPSDINQLHLVVALSPAPAQTQFRLRLFTRTAPLANTFPRSSLPASSLAIRNTCRAVRTRWSVRGLIVFETCLHLLASITFPDQWRNIRRLHFLEYKNEFRRSIVRFQADIRKHPSLLVLLLRDLGADGSGSLPQFRLSNPATVCRFVNGKRRCRRPQ